MDELTHTIDVEAGSLYEAAVVGLFGLQREEWTPPSVTEMTPIVVTMPDTGVTHTVRVRSIKRWLGRTAGSPNELLQRSQLRQRLAARGLTL